MSRLGMPDLGIATLNDMRENAAMIASLDRNIPLIADADTGFGGTFPFRPLPAPNPLSITREDAFEPWPCQIKYFVLICETRSLDGRSNSCPVYDSGCRCFTS